MFLMKGKFYEKNRVVGDWWLSHKIDGMRAFWDGGRYRGVALADVPFANMDKVRDDSVIATGLWSSAGKIIYASEDWLDKLPGFPCDGELRCGNSFADTVSVCKRSVSKKDWLGEGVVYNIFDLPNIFMGMERKVRLSNGNYWHIPQFELDWKGAIMGEWNSVVDVMEKEIEQNEAVSVIGQERISSQVSLAKRMEMALADGFEGLVIRQNSLLFMPGRQDSLLKMKPVRDVDCRVVGFVDGKGRLEGMVGSLIVETIGTDMKPGIRFKVNAGSDAKRGVWKEGDIVNVLYRELTKDGVPKEGRLRDRV